MPKSPDNSQVILDDTLAQLHAERAPSLDKSEYFEVFCAEQLLKDFDLSYDEIEDGIVDGSHDGGIDSIYTFVNGEIVGDDFDTSPFKKDVTVDLNIIQSKTSPKFTEDTIDKLISITRNALDLSKDIDALTQYNEAVRGKLKAFRTAYRALAGRFPKLNINYYLAAKRPNVASPVNFVTKCNDLAEAAKEQFPAASVEVKALGAAELLELARRQPKTVFELAFTRSLGSDEGSIVLAKLSDYNSFLRDDNGRLRKNLFESNVRDFQGKTEVNAEIQATLSSDNSPDFWWLNNGVTILSSKSGVVGNKISISDPQIVNGLQTSTQIANYFDSSGVESEDRAVMVKIISSEDEETRDKIIKATNSQNSIQPATLRATDKIQRDIEANLKSVGLFYDRRKNFYKNEGKPAEKIVSIPLMAQILMSVLLGRPDDARARPSSLIKDNSVYQSLFAETMPIQLYSFCGLLIKGVEAALKVRPDLTARDRNNLRFYVAVHLVWSALETSTPTAEEIAGLTTAELSASAISSSISSVEKHYNDLGATDQVAKGQELKKLIRTDVAIADLLG